MHNAQKPTLDDLPTKERLLKSTVIAAGVAGAILLTVVLPAEYGIDPTRIGRVLGLAEMGEIKTQLKEEREADQQITVDPLKSSTSAPVAEQQSSLFGWLVGTAHAQTAETWKDETSFVLAPGQGAEWKLVMERGTEAEFNWFTVGGPVNFDLHGDGSGQSISYEKGRGVPAATGTIKAEFTGNHGWFFRNRTGKDVTVTLQLRGAYSELKQTY